MVRFTIFQRIAAWRLGKLLPLWLAGSCLVLTAMPERGLWASDSFVSRLLNDRYGYTPKYYGHEPTGYVWPIHGARYVHAAPYYLNLPASPPAHPHGPVHISLPDHPTLMDPLDAQYVYPVWPSPLIGPPARPPGHDQHSPPPGWPLREG